MDEKVTVTIDFDDEMGFWYVSIDEEDHKLFRPGFRTKEDAQDFLDAYMQQWGYNPE